MNMKIIMKSNKYSWYLVAEFVSNTKYSESCCLTGNGNNPCINNETMEKNRNKAITNCIAYGEIQKT
jgi:hypothetical protein